MSSSTNCVDLNVYEDDLVEANETLLLQLTSDDPAILLVEPVTTEITIINTDGNTPIKERELPPPPLTK